MAKKDTRTLSAAVREDCAAGATAAFPGVCPSCGKPLVPGGLRFRVSERVEGLMDEDSFLRISDVIPYCTNCAA